MNTNGRVNEEKHDPQIAALSRAKEIALWLNAFGLYLVIWGLLYPHPLGLVVSLLAILPWIAIALAWKSNDLYTINDTEEGEQKGDLRWLARVPCGILLVMTMKFSVLDGTKVVIPAFLGGMTIAVLALRGSSGYKSQFLLMLSYVFFFSMYSAGVILFANVLFKRTEHMAYPVVVANKHHTGRKNLTYYLTFTPRLPQMSVNEVTVPRAYYDGKSLGDLVCVDVFQGALHIPWYVVRDCRLGEKNAAISG
ncbi:MAG: hypothetical protein V4488_19515 [Pseudomonadota bacterium]